MTQAATQAKCFARLFDRLFKEFFQEGTYSAVYRRPDGTVRADWIAYDGLGAALLGPAEWPVIGTRIGHIKRPYIGPPQAFGFPISLPVDLQR